MSGKNLRILKLVFWLLVGVNIMLVSCFVVSIPTGRAIFPWVVVLAIASCLLGIVLIFLTLKGKLKGKQKILLIILGASSAGFLVSAMLHNFFYALAVIFSHITILKYLMEVLHAGFFIISIFICPIGFLIGAIGSIVLFMKEGGRHSPKFL